MEGVEDLETKTKPTCDFDAPTGCWLTCLDGDVDLGCRLKKLLEFGVRGCWRLGQAHVLAVPKAY